uniref:MalT-like TPR region domain-containing protein n=1 Tax=Trieres chinensis TaxID=1514140 RepID=A0A7S2EUQ5_TRICV|eukprot:CAMPEP_0183307866 /NCGR_PEP_ID=MMETSP0160_2-20130417/19600_1 /TAXON_ID=2839 ORGANISM="Odontella Sinensis, Strain Grunow 1884" /NCGR_SAMPLE_ID=MMETSP0160_2 /ASSEMBLY_ACC=CAM_ASM_000250 /LENGTH=373 /DNA_ID=CAMNT_0025471567 /DNA_START=166 /DNA_END=1287 /DNA_ORIENTATION=-
MVGHDSDKNWAPAISTDMMFLRISNEEQKAKGGNAAVVRDGIGLNSLSGADMETSNVLIEEGILAGNLGDYERAYACIDASLKIKTNIYGAEAMNQDIARALSTMGFVLAAKGDIKGAINRYNEALTAKEGSSYTDLAATMTTIGMLHIKCGEYVNAELWLMKALDSKKNMRGSSPASIAKDLENLGDLKKICKKYKEAEDFYMQSAACYHNNINSVKVQKELSCLMSKLGLVAGAQGDYDLAQEHFESALNMKMDVYEENKENSSDLCNAMNSLGYIYAVRGHIREAIQVYEESINIQCNSAWDENFAKTLTSLGILYIEQHDLRSGQACLENALDVMREIDSERGTKGSFICVIMCNLNLCKNRLKQTKVH